MPWLRVAIISILLIGVAAPPAQAQSRVDARKFFKAGLGQYKRARYLKAVVSFRKAYALLPLPVVIYYIGLTFKDAGLHPEGARAFWQFLDEARMNHPKRAEAFKQLAAMKMPPKPPRPLVCPVCAKARVCPKVPVRRVVTRPRRPPEPFHVIIDEARPDKPLLVVVNPRAKVNRFGRVYLFYRPRGQAEYEKVPMRAGRRGIYSGCIPGRFLNNRSLQYYIDVLGITGRRVAGSGARRSPNIILLSASAPRMKGNLLRSCPR